MVDEQKVEEVEASKSESKVGFFKIFTFGVPFIVVLVLIIVVALGVGYGVYKYPSKFGLALPSETQSQVEVSELISKVSALIELPSDEQPTIATVSDVEALRQTQPFFSKAENGDRVLIFTGAKRAIVYREATNKIIDVGAVNIQAPTDIGQANDLGPVPTSTPDPEPSEEPVPTLPAASSSGELVP